MSQLGKKDKCIWVKAGNTQDCGGSMMICQSPAGGLWLQWSTQLQFALSQANDKAIAQRDIIDALKATRCATVTGRHIGF